VTLPERYARTTFYQRLRVCERFGQRPEWFDGLPPGTAAVLLAYQDVRECEEDRLALMLSRL